MCVWVGGWVGRTEFGCDDELVGFWVHAQVVEGVEREDVVVVCELPGGGG